MIDPFAADKIKTIINKEIANIKDHICYGIDSVEKLMYARGQTQCTRSTASGY
jgi:hypothetical protein